MWFQEQAEADTPFVPPENAREHCGYLMDAAQADAYLEKLGVKKVGKTGHLPHWGRVFVGGWVRFVGTGGFGGR